MEYRTAIQVNPANYLLFKIVVEFPAESAAGETLPQRKRGLMPFHLGRAKLVKLLDFARRQGVVVDADFVN